MNTTTVLDYSKHEVRPVNNNEKLLAKDRVLDLLSKGPPYATRAGFGKSTGAVQKFPFPDEPEPEPSAEADATQEPATPRQPLDLQLRKFASRGDAVHLKALLEKHVNPAGGYPFDLNARNPHNQYTAYHWACDSGHADCVEELIQAGLDTEAVDFRGRTGYDIAMEKKRLEVLATLERLNLC